MSHWQKPPLGALPLLGSDICRGLVGLWPFNEGSGNIAEDLSSNGHNGAISTATWVSGHFGHALEFNGASGDVDLGTNPWPDFWSGGSSVSVWVYAHGYGEGNNGTIVGTYADDGSSGWTFYTRSTNSGISLYVKHSVTDHSGQWTAAMSLNALHHLLVTYDSSAIANKPIFYIDGVSVTVTEAQDPQGTVVDDSANNFLIGNRNGDARTFDGLIDVPILYSRILSASEAALLYREPFCMFEEEG